METIHVILICIMALGGMVPMLAEVRMLMGIVVWPFLLIATLWGIVDEPFAFKRN